MSKTNVAMSATNCSFTCNLSTTNFQKPSGVGFGCVADNVFNVFLVSYVLDTNSDVNPELEKSRTFSVREICRAHQIRKMLVAVCPRLERKCTMDWFS